MQRLALLVPANKMELQKGSAKKDPGREENDRTEEGAPDEVLRDVAADEAAGRGQRNIAAPDDVGANMPYGRDKRPEKKAERGEGT